MPRKSPGTQDDPEGDPEQTRQEGPAGFRKPEQDEQRIAKQVSKQEENGNPGEKEDGKEQMEPLHPNQGKDGREPQGHAEIGKDYV